MEVLPNGFRKLESAEESLWPLWLLANTGQRMLARSAQGHGLDHEVLCSFTSCVAPDRHTETRTCHLVLNSTLCLFKVSDDIILNALQGCCKNPVKVPCTPLECPQMIGDCFEGWKEKACPVSVLGPLFPRSRGDISPAS